jgi:hypothetical protein
MRESLQRSLWERLRNRQYDDMTSLSERYRGSKQAGFFDQERERHERNLQGVIASPADRLFNPAEREPRLAGITHQANLDFQHAQQQLLTCMSR